VNANAILLVTEALRGRLASALGKPDAPETVFVGPLDDPDASTAPLTLFLYRVVPNASLRNREHRVPTGKVPQVVDVFQNALPLDLYYLLTVGKKTLGASTEIPLGALGAAMQALQADPDLIGPAVNYETVRVTLEPLTTEEASRIWALFPTANYRTSVAYLATPVWIDPPQAPPAAAPVTEDQLSAGSKAAEAMS
jgi:hypothetical protein